MPRLPRQWMATTTDIAREQTTGPAGECGAEKSGGSSANVFWEQKIEALAYWEHSLTRSVFVWGLLLRLVAEYTSRDADVTGTFDFNGSFANPRRAWHAIGLPANFLRNIEQATPAMSPSTVSSRCRWSDLQMA